MRRVGCATFSPDGSRLVVTTNDGPAVHVWDLRAIRKHLAEMGLDWDAPAYSDDDPAGPDLPPLPPLKVDYGPLAGELEHISEPAETLIETVHRTPQEGSLTTSTPTTIGLMRSCS